VQHVVHPCELPAEEQRCTTCGGEARPIGTDVTHTLELVPAHFVEHEYHLAKYACPRCKDGVLTAAGPAKVVERSAADASLLADVVVSKYVDHCPLHRLQRIYARDGVVLPVSTMADWVGAVAELVAPLSERLAARVKAAVVVRTDATGLRVLDPASPAHIELGTMWCYVGDDKAVVFRYAPTGSGERGPWAFLAGRQGYVQADAASVFDRLYTGQVAQAIEVGCWAHGRRRLVELQDTDARVAYPLQLIARLYRIEHLADAEHRPPDARRALRQERSQRVVEKLQRWIVPMLAAEPPSSALAKALAYFVNQWAALTRFLDDGRLALDNNLCEQQLRSIALGRKNFLFSGSHAAAERAATLYSLMRTCAQYDVEPLAYLTDVLRKLAAGTHADRLDELLPMCWRPAAAPPS
jgi:transposase